MSLTVRYVWSENSSFFLSIYHDCEYKLPLWSTEDDCIKYIIKKINYSQATMDPLMKIIIHENYSADCAEWVTNSVM